MNFTGFNILFLVINILASLITLKYIKLPYLWLVIIWMVYFIYLSFQPYKAWVRSVYFNLFIIFGFLFAAEGYFVFQEKSKQKHSRESYYSDHFSMIHPILGYAPKKNNQYRSYKKIGDTFIYLITYETKLL